MVERVADRMLRAAAIDIAACKALAATPDMADSAIGFHAQQACEKCLKAVLSAQGIEFSRTHDLLRLIDLLAEKGHPVPSDAAWIDELKPYAVEARYGLVDSGALDRARAIATADSLLAWALAQVSAAAAR
jgi:HEPN domain-containing protein